MKILFIGSVKLSYHLLEKVADVGGNVIGVCSHKNPSLNGDYCDLGSYAKKHGIACHYAEDINAPESIKWISELSPDIIFCFGWSRLLKKEALSIAPMGVVGFHPSALPRNRGKHPVIWALALGLDKTASTFFFLDEGVDSGDILSQVMIPIDGCDDAKTLHHKICLSALKQIGELVPMLSDGSYTREVQDHSNASVWRRRTKIDGMIDWKMSAVTINNLVKALSCPYGGATFQYNNFEYKLWKTELVEFDIRNIEPGKVIDIIDRQFPLIKCGEHAVKIMKTEPELRVTKGAYL